jgi:L-alanine-DL-glutamate epimerase-like enolase superfamily enzyme
MTRTARIVPRVEPLDLELNKPFRIAHGVSTVRHNALVTVGDFAGEAALPPYYATTVEDVAEYVAALDLSFLVRPDPVPIETFISRLPEGPSAAMAAIDMAVHDAWARRLGFPLYRLWGLDGSLDKPSSYAQSIPEDLDEWRDALQELESYPFLKLKLGSGDPQFDVDVVRVAREHYDGRLAVDANAAWSIPDAVELLPRLARFGLEFVEQPISYGDPDDWHLLRRLLKSHDVPLIADESVHDVDDVISLYGAADGVNLKLAKCGGLRRVRRMAEVARSLGMMLMLGCMIESSLALTAAAHLAPMFDYLDLDAMLYLADDPFSGVTFSKGYLTLPGGAGLGVTRRSSGPRHQGV